MSVPWVSWRDEPSIVSETRLAWQRNGRGTVWAGGKTTPPLGDCGDVVDSLAGWVAWQFRDFKPRHILGMIDDPSPLAVTDCSYLVPRRMVIKHDDLLRRINEGHPF